MLRRGRAGLAGAAALVTLVAVLADLGVLPAHAPEAAAASTSSARAPAERGEQAALSSSPPSDAPDAVPSSGTVRGAPGADRVVGLPADSGTGRRVVFDISAQRVWLVDAAGAEDAPEGDVVRTYPVSGSLYDNLQPGTYEVYSRSRHAVGIDDSGTMEYFVRFTRGANAAIGFHSIPVHEGKPVQTRAQLGTPLSHGCIRQARPDAIRLWRFAPVGTTVVVTA